jgi:hypothetical protein
MIPLVALVAGAVAGGVVWGLCCVTGKPSGTRTSGSLRVSGGSCCASCHVAKPCESLCGGEAELSMANPGVKFTPQGFFRGMLRQGQLYRFWMRVDPAMQRFMTRSPRSLTMTNEAFLAEAMKPIAMRLGFAQPLLVTHDPTDISVWCVLARWASPAQEILSARYVTPLQAIPVEEPPTSGRSSLSRSGEAPGVTILDEGLTNDEVWAVTHALSKDDDTKHLGGFATTFEPDYPVAAGLLRVKSMLAAVRAYRAPSQKAEEGAVASDGLIDVLRKASDGLGDEVSRSWDRFAAIPLGAQDRESLGRAVKALGAAHVRRVRGQAPKPERITPAALQFAFSTRRPQLSLVANPDGIIEKLRAINAAVKAGDPDAKKAQERIAAATRYLERLQWVEWYKRSASLAKEEGPAPGSLTGVLTIANRAQSAL